MIKKIYQSIQHGIAKISEEKIERSAEITSKLINTALLHQKTFLPYKNYCAGKKDIVVCGAGPSLNDYVPVEGAIHIAVNRAFLYEKVDFDFIFAQDYEGLTMVQEQLIDYRPGKCIKFLGTQCNPIKEIPESLALKCNALRFDTDAYIYGDGLKGKMVKELESRPLCNMMNVGQSVMQLALYMNPRRIYIVGCDMSGTHFAKGNQTEIEQAKEKEKLEALWSKKQEQLLTRWKEIKEFAAIYYPDTEIISVNPVGLKGMFKDWYQHKTGV